MNADPGDRPRLAGRAVCCPRCDSPYVTDVHTPTQQNLLCMSCGACWHRTAGQWQRVLMRDCEGCDHQAVCLAAD